MKASQLQREASAREYKKKENVRKNTKNVPDPVTIKEKAVVKQLE